MFGLSFKDLEIKIKYDSDVSDILNDFYIPTLAHSSRYYRISGFFSSTSLAISARGLEEFIKNNGKMKLICSAILSKDDYDKMKEVFSTPEELIEEKFLSEMKNISNDFVKNNLAALGFMLANGNLEIKIAVPNDERGMFHSKIGIMVDSFGDMISFSGSDNETASGWLYNIEEFKVFKSWISGQKEYFYEDFDNFNNYWECETSRFKIIDLPKAINDELINFAPNNVSDIQILDDWVDEIEEPDDETLDEKIVLRDYQEEAINNWIDNGKRGIFEMATGTGKTFTGLGCMDKLIEEYNSNMSPLLIVVAAPTSHLIDQWEKDVEKFNVDNIIKAYSSNSSWKKLLPDLLLELDIGDFNNLVILTTHITLSKDYFREFLNEYSGDSLLIVDEVHGIGSKFQRLALDETLYKYRLGLSATPERWGDDEGNEVISSFFDKIVYKFTLSDALVRINPDTGKTFLTPYEYYPIFVQLTDDEFDEYKEYSSSITLLYHKLNSSSGSDKRKILDKIEKYQFLRQKILNVAENKLVALNDLIDDLKQDNTELKDLLIYCHNSNQLTEVNKILNSKSLIKHKFTGEESIDERVNLLNHFSNGSIQVLVAMKCLDEGVDVPSARTAIILASTSNPREYIQRRGRVLRRAEGKELAIIYDMIISFSHKQLKSLNKQERDLELKIMEKESRRYREFARDAENYDYCFKLLDTYFDGVLK